jgi:hypothetical protein
VWSVNSGHGQGGARGPGTRHEGRQRNPSSSLARPLQPGIRVRRQKHRVLMHATCPLISWHRCVLFSANGASKSMKRVCTVSVGPLCDLPLMSGRKHAGGIRMGRAGHVARMACTAVAGISRVGRRLAKRDVCARILLKRVLSRPGAARFVCSGIGCNCPRVPQPLACRVRTAQTVP